MSRDRILSARGALSGSSASSVAVGFGRRTISLLLAAIVGLATFVFLLMGGGGMSTAYAQQMITAKALTDHGCDSTEWHFVITQIDDEANAPASITVVWANMRVEVVQLDKLHGRSRSLCHDFESRQHGRVRDSRDLRRMAGPIQPEPRSMWADRDAFRDAVRVAVRDAFRDAFRDAVRVASESPSESPTETPSETPSESPTASESPKPSESESPAAGSH